MSAREDPIGTLTERVRIEQRLETTLPEGGTDISFLPLATVWARVHARPGSFSVTAEARASAATHIVVMRRRTDVRPGDRLAWGGRTLEILWCEDLEGVRRFTSCGCRETRGIG